jgi:hypothetical protein
MATNAQKTCIMEYITRGDKVLYTKSFINLNVIFLYESSQFQKGAFMQHKILSYL